MIELFNFFAECLDFFHGELLDEFLRLQLEFVLFFLRLLTVIEGL